MPGSAAPTSTASATQLELDLTYHVWSCDVQDQRLWGYNNVVSLSRLCLRWPASILTWSPVSGRPEVRYEFWAMNLAVVLIERRGRDEVSIQ